MIYIIFHGLVGETAFLHVPSSYDVHRRCALGGDAISRSTLGEDAIPRSRPNEVCTPTRQVRFPNPALHTVHQEVVYTPIFNRSVVSIARWTRWRRQQKGTESPKLSSTSLAVPPLLQER